MDVEGAFLNGLLQKKVYVEQPSRFIINSVADQVYILKKAMYGLKQVLRALYGTISLFLIKNGFSKVKWTQSYLKFNLIMILY